jgi:hypothetical protein
MWTVDQSMFSAMDARVGAAPGYFTLTDMQVVADQAVQNLSRHTRARMRHRVRTSAAAQSCGPFSNSDEPCIALTSVGDNNVCSEGAVAFGVCGPSDGVKCRVAFCPQVNWNWGSGAFYRTFGHEFGHTFGLAHVSLALNDVSSNCATSDGCEGELMCAGTSSNTESQIVRQGDAKGIRLALDVDSLRNNRVIGYGTRTPGIAGLTSSADPGSAAAMFAPRIDCATFVNGSATCVSVRDRQSINNTETTVLEALLSPQANGGWNVRVPVANLASSVQLVSDVAVSPLAERAMFTRVSETNAVVSVNAVDLTTSAAVVSTSLGYRAAFPPRISYDDDVSGFLVLGTEAGVGVAPKWRLHKVVMSGQTVTVTPIDLGTMDDSPAEGNTAAVIADYDFDCQTKLIGTSTCVVVAVLARRATGPNANPDDDPGRIWSRRFTVASPNNTASLVDASWKRSDIEMRAQAVIGVSLASDNRMFVSLGRQQSGSFTPTRDREYATADVSQTAVFVDDSNADVSTCSSGTSYGYTMAASTPHGGTSIDYCPLCSNGQIRSMRLGLGETGYDFCF